MPLILAKFWKEIVMGLAILLFVGYIMTLRTMVDFYKDKAAKLERVVASLVVRNKELAGAATELSRKYEVRGSAIYKADEKRAKENAERIANDQVTKRIKLPAIAVQLFNGTHNESESKPTAPAVGSNDGRTDRVEAASSAEVEATLNDLLVQNNENRKNHDKAVSQVKEWQSFWSDYVRSVEKADTDTPLPKKQWGFWNK